MEGASSIDLTSPILKSMIRQTLFAVADTDAKPVHTGTLFNIENGSSAWCLWTATGWPCGRK